MRQLLLGLLLWIFHLSAAPPAQAQPDAAQLRQLQEMPADTNKINLLWKVGMKYRRYDLDSCFHYFYASIQLADELQNPEFQIWTRLKTALIENDDGDLRTGLSISHEALRLAKKTQEPEYLVESYNSLGIAYRDLAIPDSSFYYHNLAEQIAQQNGLTEKLWMCYLNLGILFNNTQDYDKASGYLEKGYNHVKESDNRIQRGVSLFWLAENYFYGDDLEKYVQIVNDWHDFMSEKAYNPALDSPQHGSLMVFDPAAPEVEGKLKKAIQIAVEQKSSLAIALQYQSLGFHYAAANRTTDAIDAYEKALVAYNNINIIYGAYEILSRLYKLHKTEGNPEALTYLEQFSAMRDSLQNAEQLHNINELEVQYETEKKNQQIAERTRERNSLLISSTLLGLLLLLSVLFFRNRLVTNRKLAQNESALQQQKIRQLEQDQQLLRYSALIDGQEMERRRIAKDLHDSIGGSLSAIKSHLTAVEEQVEDLQTQPLFERTKTIVNHTFEDVRRISLDLMPRVLELMGLAEAIEDIGARLRQRGIDCKVEIIDLQQEPPRHLSINIYRIIQELCNNIFKHAQAKNVLIQLIFQPKQLDILVEDDGIGFDFVAASRSSQLGLSSLQSRVNFLKGKIDFDSVPDEGTAVFVQIPLGEENT